MAAADDNQTSDAGLTEDELETLRKGATGAGMLVAVSDRSFFDSFKEAGALAKHLVQARQGSTSEIVKKIAEGRGTGFGLTASPQEIETETVASLGEAKTLLEAKAPGELEAYRTFVVELARSVGQAAGGGDDVEAAAVAKIEAALA